jgi:hypothetical protein
LKEMAAKIDQVKPDFLFWPIPGTFWYTSYYNFFFNFRFSLKMAILWPKHVSI